MIRRLRPVPGFVAASLLAAGLLWGAFNAWIMLGDNHRHVLSPYVVPSESWQMVAGEGVVRESDLQLQAPGPMGYVLVAGALPDAIDTDWLDAIVVHFAKLGDHHEMQAGVSRSANLAGLREAPLRLDEKLEGRLDADELFLSDGSINFVTLRVRGGLGPSTVVEQVELHRVRPDFTELQGLLWTSLVDPGGWTQRSINHTRPEYVPLRVSPVVAVVCWLGLFVFLTLLLVDRASLPGRRTRMLVGLGVLIGWLSLDASWQVSLWLRHVDAVSRYSGIPAEDKTINDLDAEVAGFVSDLRDALDNDSQPVVIFAESLFEYFRARYASVPQPVVGRLGLRSVWLRRLRPHDVMVTLDLHAALHEQPVSVDEFSEPEEPRELPLKSMAGRHAELTDCPASQIDCRGSTLRLKEGKRPWLVEVPWLDDLDEGIWQVEFDLTGGHQAGWVQLEVFRRSMGNSKRWAWREVYLGENIMRTISLAFRADEGAEYRMGLRERNALGVSVYAIRLLPKAWGDDLVELSLDGDPPYFLARRILKSGGKFAWEML